MPRPNLRSNTKTNRKTSLRQPSVAEARASVASLTETAPQPGAPHRPAIDSLIGNDALRYANTGNRNDAPVRHANTGNRKTPASPDSLAGRAAQPSGPQRAAIDALFTNGASVRNAVTENLKAFRAEAERASARIEKAFVNFNPTQLSPEERQRRYFVARGAAPRDMSKAVEEVIKDGLERIEHSGANAKITIQDSGDLKRLIKEKSPRASSGGKTIALRPLLEVINRKQSELAFMGSDPAIALCKSEREAQEVIDHIETPSSNRGAPLQDRCSSTGDQTVAQFVRDAVKGQMQSAKAPEIQLEYSPSIPNTANKDEVQSRILETFQLRPGPSDVASYHDFNTLQIAFAHVWTQIFDGQLESLGKELYHEYVQLKSFTGVTDADVPVSTLDDLRRLMATVRALSQAAQDKIPNEIRGNGGTSNGPKGAGDLGDEIEKGVKKGALGAVLGPIGLFLEEMINAIANPEKPRITWAHFFGGLQLNRPQDKIIARAEPKAASGTVEIALVRTPGQRWRSIEFQQYDPSIGPNPFFRAVTSNNSKDPPWQQHEGGPANDGTPIVLATSQLEGGLLQFSSQQGKPSEEKSGRYVLGNLSEVLKDGTRVTFDWVEG